MAFQRVLRPRHLHIHVRSVFILASATGRNPIAGSEQPLAARGMRVRMTPLRVAAARSHERRTKSRRDEADM